MYAVKFLIRSCFPISTRKTSHSKTRKDHSTSLIKSQQTTPKPQFLFGDTNNLQFKSDLHHHELLQSRPASSRCSSSSRFDRSSPISLLPFLYSIEFSLSFKIWFHCNSPMSLWVNDFLMLDNWSLQVTHHKKDTRKTPILRRGIRHRGIHNRGIRSKGIRNNSILPNTPRSTLNLLLSSSRNKAAVV